MKLFAALIFLVISVYADRVMAQATSCPPVNMGFEQGNFNGWLCDTGHIDQNGNINVITSNPVNNRQTLISASYTPVLDPFGKFPTLCPFGGKYSVKLGNEQTGGGAERMSYTFTVPTGQSTYDITFYYAVVFQNPSHLPYQQPRFTIKTFDVTDNTAIDCASFDFIAGTPAEGFRKAPVIAPQDTQVYYKDWSSSSIHMVGLGGKLVRLEFTTNDCTLGGHFGYAYVDVEENCSSGITGNSYCTGEPSVTLTAPGGILDYQWYTADLSKKLANAQQLTISPPPPDGTKYAVVLSPYPGLGCTDTLYTIVNKNNASFNFKVVDTLFGCAGGTVDLTAPSVTAGSDPNLQFSYSPDPIGSGYIYKPQSIDTSGTYYIKAVNPDGCENILPVQVVIANPKIAITNPPPVYFPATVDLSTAFTAAAGSTYKYFTDSTATNPVVNFQKIAKSGTYYVQVTNIHGCQTIAPIVVVINPPQPIEYSTPTGTITSCSGTASASPYLQQFNVGGYGLTADITATAPGGFELSLDPNMGFASSLVFAQSGGIIITTPVYVRASATAKAGAITGNVVLSSPGQTSKDVGVSATISQSPSVNSVGDLTYKNGDQTTAIDFSGTGNTYTWINDTPGIGLAASGTGAIAPFTAVNTGTSAVTANITVTPSSIGNAYIANFNSGNVSVISTETGLVTSTIASGSNPVGVAISPDQTFVYVTNTGSNSISVIDTRSNSVSATITVGQNPIGIVISPDGSKLYVTNSADNTVSVVSIVTNTVVAKIVVGGSPAGIAISPDGGTLYVGNDNGSSVSVINTAANTVSATIPLSGYPNGLVVSPDGKTLYVSIASTNSIAVINTSTNAISTIISVGNDPFGITESSDGNYIYVVNKGANSVSVINTATNSVSKTIAVGNNPVGVSLNQDNTKLYVTNQISNTVSIIDTKTQAVTSTVNVGTSPESIGGFVSTGTGCSGLPQTFTITVTPTANAAISFTGNLNPLSTTYGTPSPPESFSVSGVAMTAGILTTPPNGFEVSTDDIKFSSTVTVGAAGAINPTNVYVRLSAITPVGNNYAGNIALTSKGATTVNVPIPVSTVLPAPLTITATNKDKLFGQPNPALTVSYSGFVNQETSPVLTTLPVATTTALINSAPGQYPITPSGAAALNYSFLYVPGILTILPPAQSLVIPNTFTPNGDGVNDSWNIKNLDTYSNCTVSVFTRYGQKVYSSLGYVAPWDGTCNGKLLPTGTYYYIIDLKNNQPPLAGWVTLIH
jgi:gliding motility-associated-like protein